MIIYSIHNPIYSYIRFGKPKNVTFDKLDSDLYDFVKVIMDKIILTLL